LCNKFAILQSDGYSLFYKLKLQNMTPVALQYVTTGWELALQVIHEQVRDIDPLGCVFASL
jgi:hypothetical protein